MIQVLHALKRGTALCEHSAAGHAIIPGAPPRKLTCNADAALLVQFDDGHDEAMCAECFAELYIDRGNRGWDLPRLGAPMQGTS